jgi:hypothetical protein
MATEIKIQINWLQAGFQGVLGTINTVASRFDEFNKAVNNGGAALQTAFQGALALFGVHALKDYSTEAINAAKSQAQLVAALKSTGQYSPEYVALLAEIADATEKVTGTTDDTIRQVQRILTQFGVGKENMERFVMLTLDMAAAMGTDATSAAQRLGLVLDGNTQSVRGFTVQVDKSLPLVERLQSVFDQVNRQVGGSALASFNATPKGLIQFQLATEHLKETLGGVYNSAVEPFFAGLARGLNATDEWWKKVNAQPGFFIKLLQSAGGSLGRWLGDGITKISIVIGALTLLTLGIKTFIGTRNVIAAFWYAFSGLGVEAMNIVQARYLLFTTSIGTMTASWGAAVASGFAGWNAGRFLGEIKIGSRTLDQWIQVSIIGWRFFFEVVIATVKAGWEIIKVLFEEGMVAAEAAVNRGVIEIAKYWNQIPGVPKINTTGFEQSLVDANAKLVAFARQREKIINGYSTTFTAISDKAAQDRDDTLGKTSGENAKTQAAADQARAQSAFSTQLARMAREFAAKLLTLSAQASRDNSAAVIKNEEALYQQGILSFEQYMKARSTALRAQFNEDRLDIQRQITVIAEQLKLKTDELARASSEGKLAEATQLTLERNDLQLKLQQAKDALRKLGRDNAQTQLDTQIQLRQHARDLAAARASGGINNDELNVSRVEADPYLTDKERVKQLLPLLDDEIAKKQVLIDQLVQRKAESNDDQQKIDLQNQINALLGEQLQLQTKSKELSDSQSFVGSLKRDWSEFYNSVSSTSKNLADLIVSPFKGLRDGLSDALDTLITKGGTLKSFFVGVGQSIEKSMVQSFSNMVADWVTSNIMMLIRWAATQLGITALFAGHTATRTAIHAAGEGAQTAATGTGASSRNAFRLFETIFHVAQMAVRVVAHIGGELAMTAASLAQSLLRRLGAFLEAQPYIFLAAVKAASSVADIPYVGWLLAPLAFAAVFAGLEAAAVFAKGGLVQGPGSETSDSIPARLSKGEFVIPAARVRDFGVGFFEDIRTGAVRAQDLAGAIAPSMGLVPVGVNANGGGNGNVNVEGHTLTVGIIRGRAELVDFMKSKEGRKVFIQLGREHRRDIGIET